jgi:GNAT superfamily N-acetyltransferase
MLFRVRSWSDVDAGNDREISQAIYPEYRKEPGHPAWFPARQLGMPSECSCRYVAVDIRDDRPVGYASLWKLRPRRYRFDLAVRPDWQKQGIATQLLSQVTKDATALGATGLQARVRDDKHDALEFIRRRGYLESHRMGAYRLDFGDANVMEFQEARIRLQDCGVELTNLADARQQNSDYRRQFYELYSAAREGWPDPDPTQAELIPFEWVSRWLEDASQPEALFMATYAQRYIGFSSIFDIGTAVHPSFRGRGIATLLKSASVADARARGFHGQTTSTASPAMQRVLQRLGYKRLWAEIRLIREMA